MVKNPIDMSLVFRRDLCMADSRESTDNGYGYYEAAMNSINSKFCNYNVKGAVEKLFVEAASKSNSERYYKKCVKVLNQLYENNRYDLLEESSQMFISNIVPYCKDQNDVDTYCRSMNLGEPVLDKIHEACSQYKICDRILDNHNKLSKRFKIDDVIRSKYTSLEEICLRICEMIDTYDIKPHIKMELCFEEIQYLMDHHAMPINEQSMVETVTDYFLYTESSGESISNYVKAINESKVLSVEADKNIKYLTNPSKKTTYDTYYESYDITAFTENGNTIKSLINQYKMDTKKDDSQFKAILNRIFTQPPMDILQNSPDILKYIRYFLIFSTINSYVTLINAIMLYILNRYLQLKLRKNEMERLIQYFKNERDIVESSLVGIKDREKEEKLTKYLSQLNKCIGKFEDYERTLYSKSEYDNRKDYGLAESYYSISNEATKVVLNNLISDAQKADEFISRLEKDTLNRNDVERTDIKDTVTSENVLYHLDQDSRISITLCSYDITKCKDKSSLYETVDAIMKSTNNMLHNRKGKVYYTMLENCIDVIFRSKFKLITSLYEEQEYSNRITEADGMRMNHIIESANLMEQIYNTNPHTIIEDAIKKIGIMSREQSMMFIEAWSYGSPIEREDMNKFVSECVTYYNENGDFIDAYEMKTFFENALIDEYADIYSVAESTRIMRDLITESVDLNSLKLALMSFKKKAKTLSAKEQQASRNLDMSFNNLVRGIKNFYRVTDHREQIIRGQVTPSISKIIKIGISLAGLGVVSGGFVFPALAAVTGLAISKHASNTERKLIIDEYDIELQVVEREIERCKEQGKSSKKYRTLLTYQKNIQREKQRIVYNLAKKGHSLPVKSTAGFKGGDD